jgi:hypothetical protein
MDLECPLRHLHAGVQRRMPGMGDCDMLSTNVTVTFVTVTVTL